MVYRDRREAGRLLAERLLDLTAKQPCIAGLPRGGVPVAYEVAKGLQAPLDVIVVRKLGAPFQPELGFGAISEEGVRVVNSVLVTRLGITDRTLDETEARERRELERRVAEYRGSSEPLSLADRVVVVVDDGLATGYTARAAIATARRRGANEVILSVPVAARSAVVELEGVADQVVCPQQPRFLGAVGQWYEDFSQTRDQEVTSLLERSASG